VAHVPPPGLDDDLLDDLAHPDNLDMPLAAAPPRPPPLPRAPDSEAAARSVPGLPGAEEELEEYDPWGAPPGFAQAESAKEEAATKATQPGGLPDFSLIDEAKVVPTDTQLDPQAMSTLQTLALAASEDANQQDMVKPSALPAELTLPELSMGVVKRQTETVFGNKFARAMAEAVGIPRQRIKVQGFEEAPVKVMFNILEPGPDELPGRSVPGGGKGGPLPASDILAELTRQLDDPASKLRLGEIGPFLANAVADRGFGAPGPKMERGTLSAAYAAPALDGEPGREKPVADKSRSMAWMSTAEPQGSLRTTGPGGSTWGLSRLDPGSTQAGQRFRTTCPKAEDDQTSQPWAMPYENQQMYTFYDQKAEDVAKETPVKLPPSKHKFTTHASFHLTRHPSNMEQLKSILPPGQAHLAAAASWLESTEARLQDPLAPGLLAKDLDLKEAAGLESPAAEQQDVAVGDTGPEESAAHVPSEMPKAVPTDQAQAPEPDTEVPQPLGTMATGERSMKPKAKRAATVKDMREDVEAGPSARAQTAEPGPKPAEAAGQSALAAPPALSPAGSPASSPGAPKGRVARRARVAAAEGASPRPDRVPSPGAVAGAGGSPRTLDGDANHTDAAAEGDTGKSKAGKGARRRSRSEKKVTMEERPERPDEDDARSLSGGPPPPSDRGRAWRGAVARGGEEGATGQCALQGREECQRARAARTTARRRRAACTAVIPQSRG